MAVSLTLDDTKLAFSRTIVKRNNALESYTNIRIANERDSSLTKPIMESKALVVGIFPFPAHKHHMGVDNHNITT